MKPFEEFMEHAIIDKSLLMFLLAGSTSIIFSSMLSGTDMLPMKLKWYPEKQVVLFILWRTGPWIGRHLLFTRKQNAAL